MKAHLKNRNGQAIIMVTLALVAMCGLLGLVVDLGWSFYVKKSAQSAADAAALAAVEQVYQTQGGYPACASGTVECSTESCSSAAGNLKNGCDYAKQLIPGLAAAAGFTAGGDSGRQNVTMDSNVGSPSLSNLATSTKYSVSANYWVTARIYQGLPQLFSSVMGNTFGGASARATAAIANSPVNGTLYALNRENDPSACGQAMGSGAAVDICGGGNTTIDAGSGFITLASNITGAGDVAHQASKGSGTTYTRTGGTANWAYTTLPDGPLFYDPMSGKGQPPAPSLPLTSNTFPVIGGTLNGTIQPGYYYATDASGKPSGATLNFNNVTFGSSSTFNEFVFFGGANFQGTLTLNPGIYVFAGVCPACPGGSSNALNLQGTTVQEGAGDTTGEILVFTKPGYPGLSVPTAISSSTTVTLTWGDVDMKNGSFTQLGLNPNGSVPLPSDLNAIGAPMSAFSSIAWWTDQRSSPVLYNSFGNVVTSGCGSATETGGTASLDNPCTNSSGEQPDGQVMKLEPGNPNVNITGAIYQPRGSTFEIDHGTGSFGETQLITGSVELNSGNGSITTTGVGTPPTQIVVALIQ
jgi:hypothetical protein